MRYSERRPSGMLINVLQIWNDMFSGSVFSCGVNGTNLMLTQMCSVFQSQNDFEITHRQNVTPHKCVDSRQLSIKIKMRAGSCHRSWPDWPQIYSLPNDMFWCDRTQHSQPASQRADDDRFKATTPWRINVFQTTSSIINASSIELHFDGEKM